MPIVLGVIADDLTGATDVAGMLAKSGMRTVQAVGVPSVGLALPASDAVVVALKTRSIPAAEAVQQSLAALAWLQAAGARQILFKYCSTFDSTDAGNIGPVADALLAALGADFTLVCPAFPENGRTIYQGHLFVGDRLLSESGMQNHPLTPMTDSDLVRVLARQTAAKVGLVASRIVSQGADAIAASFAALRRDGVTYAVVDATANADLVAIGAAAAGLALVTGGSGIALGLPGNFVRSGLLAASDVPAPLPAAKGLAAVVSGSCSRATLGQVAEFSRTHPAFAIDPLRLAAGDDVVAEALAWAGPHLGEEPVLVYASAPPETVRQVQAQVGREAAGAMIEGALARITAGLLERGVGRLVVAGGETSGAVIQGLGIPALQIGPEIDPGVPWTWALGDRQFAVALKSGNFGSPDFFLKAFRSLP